jgi:hypothetical protein
VKLLQFAIVTILIRILTEVLQRGPNFPALSGDKVGTSARRETAGTTEKNRLRENRRKTETKN